MRLLYLLPPIRRWWYRRQVAALHAEQRSWRRQAAQHNAAVARIIAQPHPDPCRNRR
jgi:hypothetical protein